MLSQINIGTWAVLFTVYLGFDMFYILYIQSVTSLKAFRAANIGVVMYLLTAYGTIEYISNPTNLLPILLGSWLGSFLTLKYSKRHGENQG